VTIPANTATQAAVATHTQPRAKSVIHPTPATLPTAKLHAAYIPSGNTVANRRMS
jgi:hypothetical protein